jgi:flavin-dependent thymidylate synthase
MSNTVELLGYYGGDDTHALSAWQSTKREITPERRARMPQFLKDLASGHTMPHATPFEKSAIHFQLTTDLATHIHLLKHRVGVSLNAESARYKEFKEDRFYVPDDWPEGHRLAAELHYDYVARLYHQFVEELTPKLGRKRAKESARFVLPYGHQLSSDVMFNFGSFVHFQRLRNSPDAQKEIREIAQEMLRLVKATGKFDLSIAAFELEKCEEVK